jgi:polar amino acid transport system permease protein
VLRVTQTTDPDPIAPSRRGARPRTGPAPEAVPVRHRGRWVATVVIAVLAVLTLRSVVVNERFEWHVVGDYLFNPLILDGVKLTLLLTVAAMSLAIAVGLVVAVMRLSPSPIVSGSAYAFLWFFRGVPLLVQLIFWYNLAALYPHISVGIPLGPTFFEADVNTVITPFVAALLGLGLNAGAYMSEIVRGGILSVDRGQTEAAQALGMTRLKTLRHVVLPQAMRVIIPPTGNETISMLKMTSLVSVLSLSELLYSAQVVYQRTFQTIPLLIVVSLWYLALVSVLSFGQYFVERHFSDSRRPAGRGWIARRVRSGLASFPLR